VALDIIKLLPIQQVLFLTFILLFMGGLVASLIRLNINKDKTIV
jgi:hypothetical protein